MNVVLDPRRQKLRLVAITAFNVVYVMILTNQLAKRNLGQSRNSPFHTVWTVFESDSGVPFFLDTVEKLLHRRRAGVGARPG